MTIEGCMMNYYTFAVITAFIAFVFFAPTQLWLVASDQLLICFAVIFAFSMLWSLKTKGATAYHWKLWRFTLSVCYMRGEYWRWKPWKRVSFHYWNPKK